MQKAAFLVHHLRARNLRAHLAFTNHFVYCQRHDPIQVPGYARRYEEILDSLMAGGSFAYAPGVEILEDKLGKEEFTVDRWPFLARFTATKITRKAPKQTTAQLSETGP